MYKYLFNFNKIYFEFVISEIIFYELGKFGYLGILIYMNL